VAAAASNRARAGPSATLLALALALGVGAGVAAPSPARADDAAPLSDERILGTTGSGLRLQSVTMRATAFDQYGHGYQSQAGPVLGPGSERATISEGQAEVIMKQGDRWTHRVWVPVDVVSAASPDAIDNGPRSADVVSSASHQVTGGTFDWTATYKVDRATDLSARNALHLEQPFRSWNTGLTATRSFADECTVLSAGVIGLLDWFDRFDVTGHRHGETSRSGTTGSVSLTQVLTPTTVANVNYGLTVLNGTLGNTWNSVPLASGDRGPELLPSQRVRHALVGRASQFLPWNGALRGYYRFYADDWGIVAHTVEGLLMQRLSAAFYVGALYRFHTQTGATFFTTLAPVDAPLQVADSKLAPLDSHTLGGRIVADFPVAGGVRALHFELGVERYYRTNDLQMNIVTWATGFRF
jgi:hypothetical protein